MGKSVIILVQSPLVVLSVICQAGLGQGKDLKLVLEPKAAAAFCLCEICNISISKPTTDEVNYYLLADCGGGTIDIVVHKLTRKPSGEIHIAEIHQAHEGAYGGFAVNDEFEKMLQRMFQLSAEDLSSINLRQWSKLISSHSACIK